MAVLRSRRELSDERLQVFRQRRGDLERLLRLRMAHDQARRVQRLPRQQEPPQRLGVEALLEVGEEEGLVEAVDLVADDREALVVEVAADLVAPAGEEAAADQRERGEAPLDGDAGPRRRAVRHDAAPVVDLARGMVADRRVDHEVVVGDDAVDDGEVFLHRLAPAHLPAHFGRDRVALRDEQDAARLEVEAVAELGDDRRRAARRRSAELLLQPRDHRVLEQPPARMDRDPRRLVDRDEMLVLVEDRQPRQRTERGELHFPARPRQFHEHRLARAHLPRRPGRATGELDLVALDQLFDLRARAPGAALGEEAIEPQPPFVTRDDQLQVGPLHGVASARRKLSRFSWSSGAQRFCPTRCSTTWAGKTTLVTCLPSSRKKWTRFDGPRTTTVSSCTSQPRSSSPAPRASSNALWVGRPPSRARSRAWPVRRPSMRVRWSRSRLASRRSCATRLVKRSKAMPIPGTRVPPRPEKTPISRRIRASASWSPSRIVSSSGAGLPAPAAPPLGAAIAGSGRRPIRLSPSSAPSGGFCVLTTWIVSAITSLRSCRRRSGGRPSGSHGAK